MVGAVKLRASASVFESLPPSVWQSFKRSVLVTASEWGIPLEIEDDLTVRDAEHRFTEWQRRPIGDTESD